MTGCKITTDKDAYGTQVFEAMFGCRYYNHICTTHDAHWSSGDKKPRLCWKERERLKSERLAAKVKATMARADKIASDARAAKAQKAWDEVGI